jgi:hypothetical protein
MRKDHNEACSLIERSRHQYDAVGAGHIHDVIEREPLLQCPEPAPGANIQRGDVSASPQKSSILTLPSSCAISGLAVPKK